MDDIKSFRSFCLLLLLGIMFVSCPGSFAEQYQIDISPMSVAPDEKINVVLHDIPQDVVLNLTINGDISATAGEESAFLIRNFSYPYYDKSAYFNTIMTGFVPGTEATASVFRMLGEVEASYTGEVNETGGLNTSIIHELNPSMYNVSVIGIPENDIIHAFIDFGCIARADNSTDEPVTSKSSFILSGFNDGQVEINVYIDGVPQETKTISVI
ncbi:MAG: hypothetical protein GXY48_12555 [Methanomicrobiales archaeon]|nr:hypothetical protein [Methanomicrobiales archaeon]